MYDSMLVNPAQSDQHYTNTAHLTRRSADDLACSNNSVAVIALWFHNNNTLHSSRQGDLGEDKQNMQLQSVMSGESTCG